MSRKIINELHRRKQRDIKHTFSKGSAANIGKLTLEKLKKPLHDFENAMVLFLSLKQGACNTFLERYTEVGWPQGFEAYPGRAR
jgi:hypothetical protein